MGFLDFVGDLKNFVMVSYYSIFEILFGAYTVPIYVWLLIGVLFAIAFLAR
ncbi:hypothetical protein HUU53_00280 [Candidatus Micrarchaeota archaeon]|nr:hypothetical protein [Candidatus Micrarchaeota archaeon]